MASRRPRGRFLTHWLPVLLWMAVIMVGTSIPRPPRMLMIEGGDKIAHFVVYAILGGLLVRAFRRVAGLGTWRAALIGTLAGCAYGALDELHQAFLPTRTCSMGDLVADAIGVVGAAALATIIARAVTRARKRRQPIEPQNKEEM